MSSIKKRFIIIFFMIILFLLISSQNNIFSEVKNTSYSKDFMENIKVYVYTETIDTFDKEAFKETFKEEDIDFLVKNFNAKVEYNNDNVILKMKVKAKPASNNKIILYADNNPVEVNEDGSIFINKNTKIVSRNPTISLYNMECNEHNCDKHNHFEKDENDYVYGVDLSDFNNTKAYINSSNPEIIFKTSSGKLLTVMDKKEEEFLNLNKHINSKGYGDKYYEGDWVHCNRFNGQLSDDVHYNWRTGSPLEKAKAVRNFYSSDCHCALVQAFSGCTSIGSCQCNTTKRAAYCSSFTRDEGTLEHCPYTFHHHTNLTIPR